MEIFMAVLNVLGILLLIGVAAFIIIFLSDLVISFVEGKKGIFFSRGEKSVKEEQKVEEPAKALTFEDEQKDEKTQEVDFDRAELEKQLMDERDLLIEERKKAIADNETEKPEEKETEDLDALYAQLIDEINSETEEKEEKETQEVVATEPEEIVEEQPAEEDDDIDFDEIMNMIDANNQDAETTNNQVVEEVAEEQPAEEAKEEAVENVEEVEAVEEKVDENAEKVKDLQAQLEELQNQLKQERELAEQELAKANEEKESLAKALEEKQAPVVVADGETLESLMARKENLEERLKEAEKELKANKKEFLPLSKIKKSLESNESKLRRKEAIVAKKKIMLFGVNNYVVDAEKEQQLNDDLDALEALRLSVQHCEDVMKENEDRYPILEKTNAILTKTVEDLKADLDTVNAKIQSASDAGTADAE